MWSWSVPEPANGSALGQDWQYEYTAKNLVVKTGDGGRE